MDPAGPPCSCLHHVAWVSALGMFPIPTSSLHLFSLSPETFKTWDRSSHSLKPSKGCLSHSGKRQNSYHGLWSTKIRPKSQWPLFYDPRLLGFSHTGFLLRAPVFEVRPSLTCFVLTVPFARDALPPDTSRAPTFTSFRCLLHVPSAEGAFSNTPSSSPCAAHLA